MIRHHTTAAWHPPPIGEGVASTDGGMAWMFGSPNVKWGSKGWQIFPTQHGRTLPTWSSPPLKGSPYSGYIRYIHPYWVDDHP